MPNSDKKPAPLVRKKHWTKPAVTSVGVKDVTRGVFSAGPDKGGPGRS